MTARSLPDTARRLWAVSLLDGNDAHPYVGDLFEVMAHTNRLHRQTGIQHVAVEETDLMARLQASLEECINE